jgi:hypothetical protein
MLSLLLVVVVGVGGIVVGAVGHAFFAKEALATENDLASWSARLRSAITQDAITAKARLEALATELENKIKKL